MTCVENGMFNTTFVCFNLYGNCCYNCCYMYNIFQFIIKLKDTNVSVMWSEHMPWIRNLNFSQVPLVFLKAFKIWILKKGINKTACHIQQSECDSADWWAQWEKQASVSALKSQNWIKTKQQPPINYKTWNAGVSLASAQTALVIQVQTTKSVPAQRHLWSMPSNAFSPLHLSFRKGRCAWDWTPVLNLQT